MFETAQVRDFLRFFKPAAREFRILFEHDFLGHVLCDHEAGALAAAERDAVGFDLHHKGRTVFAHVLVNAKQIPRRIDLEPTERFGGGRRSEPRYRHLQEFFARVSVGCNGGAVHIQEAQLDRIVDPHRQRKIIEDAPIALLRMDALGDVGEDADADERALADRRNRDVLDEHDFAVFGEMTGGTEVLRFIRSKGLSSSPDLFVILGRRHVVDRHAQKLVARKSESIDGALIDV